MIKIYTYGSLRKGEYNHNSFINTFGSAAFKYEGTEEIEGFDLYSLGSYPTIVPNPNAESTLVVDAFKVSEPVNRAIDSMEFGAGYKAKEINGRKIYYMDEVPSYNKGKVDHGDWSKYLAEKNND